MYISKIHQEKDWEQITSFVREFSFGLLVTTGADGLPLATHLPLDLAQSTEGTHLLRGHMARANAQWKTFDRSALAVFSSPHAYISSSWYNHINVPTWNYLAVHVYGPVRLLEGPELIQMLHHQVTTYEGARPNAFSIDQFTPAELQQHLRGLVGFEMTIERVEAASKLSQNRDPESYANIVTHLRETTDSASLRIAQEMEKRAPRD